MSEEFKVEEFTDEEFTDEELEEEEGEVVDDTEGMEAEELSDDFMEEVAGGKGTPLSENEKDKYHYRKNFVRRKVHGVKRYDATSELTLRSAPNGPVMYGYGWQNGETILINKYTSTWRNGWVFAYSEKNGGAFGYVDKRFIKGLK